MKLSQLKPLQKNPFKSRGDKQIAAIGRSIQEFEKMMEVRKIVIDEEFNILGGNKRYFALKALGRAEIPDSWVDQVVGLTDAQKREFIVKDNAHWGSEWDMEMLKEWNVDVEDWGVEVDWDNVSFGIIELDQIVTSYNINIKCNDPQQFESMKIKLNITSSSIQADNLIQLLK